MTLDHEMVEGISGTLSFQPDPNTLSFSEEVKNLKSYRGTEPFYPERFVENIKHEYMCPICKEVLDQPVQTKCQAPHIFCASCLSFAFETCGSLCPVCRTAIENPQEFIEPAPFVLRTILPELDFQCPTCTHTIKLHQLPQHQESCIPNPVTTPIQNETPVQGAVSVTSPPPSPVTPPPALAAAPAVAEHVPAPAELTEPGPATTYAEQLTVQQLLHSPQEVYRSLKKEVGLFIIRQFLSQSQDGTTILLKTGGQVDILNIE